MNPDALTIQYAVGIHAQADHRHPTLPGLDEGVRITLRNARVDEDMRSRQELVHFALRFGSEIVDIRHALNGSHQLLTPSLGPLHGSYDDETCSGEVVEARSESNEHLGLLQRFQICDPDDGERAVLVDRLGRLRVKIRHDRVGLAAVVTGQVGVLMLGLDYDAVRMTNAVRDATLLNVMLDEVAPVKDGVAGRHVRVAGDVPDHASLVPAGIRRGDTGIAAADALVDHVRPYRAQSSIQRYRIDPVAET